MATTFLVRLERVKLIQLLADDLRHDLQCELNECVAEFEKRLVNLSDEHFVEEFSDRSDLPVRIELADE